ncbi:MAG: DUF5915 domain-containing protein [Minisyncoccales bacterium]
MGLKWPLAKVIVYSDKLDKELEIIIKEQLNVKEVSWKKVSKEISVELDFKMTPELEAEGYARELSRKVQAFRKKKGLNKEDKIKLELFLDNNFKKIIEKNIEFVKERTNAIEIIFNKYESKEKFKNIEEFKIKDKKGGVNIITNEG